jgi:hypothetical protein
MANLEKWFWRMWWVTVSLQVVVVIGDLVVAVASLP